MWPTPDERRFDQDDLHGPHEFARKFRRSGLVQWRLHRVIEFVETHSDEVIGLEKLARIAGLSRMHFAAQFKEATGMRPHAYVVRKRIERAQTLLRLTRTPLAEVALAVGFQSQAHFTSWFRQIVNDTPARWRRTHFDPKNHTN